MEEDKSISSEVDRRRMRLDAGRPEDIRDEVGCTIWGASKVCRLAVHYHPSLPFSKLPSMYDEIINHPSTSDELRRSTEAKLFRYRLKYLKALPVNDPKKEMTLKLVDEMMRGMVLLDIPDELVWTQFLESKNAGQLGMLLFLSSPLSNRWVIIQMNIISTQCVDMLNSSPCLR